MQTAEQPEFLSIVERQMQLTEVQGMAIRGLVEGIRQMHLDVTEKVEEVQLMVQEVRDSVTLNDRECFVLQSAVQIRSTSLTKDRYQATDDKFNVVVGRHRRMIWSKLKVRFSVAKYSHIRRIDYEDALEFAQNFRPEDYL
ncbi:ORF6C domain-containing protein [Paenibacillus sp. 2RAB27]|uniref:ORF6C domain-containing protein n=1 Tax=Paenibacillus sp. 2RAB27 TaxID=3232991 RepID=UPI003F9B2B91